MDLENFIEEEIKEITEKYKADPSEVREELTGLLKENPRLSGIILSEGSMKRLKKRREYKDLIKGFRKNIYYHLRRYYSDKLNGTEAAGKEMAEKHISVKERKPFQKEFNHQLVSNAGAAETIFDIGGGLFPLTLPFSDFKNLKNFSWLDKDENACEILKEHFSDQKEVAIRLYCESIGSHPWGYYLPEGKESFDLVMMIKLVSVIWRQEKELIPFLASVPAKKILVTAPKEALTKKESIEYRENKVLKNFIALTGKKITAKLEIENEFGYFLE